MLVSAAASSQLCTGLRPNPNTAPIITSPVLCSRPAAPTARCSPLTKYSVRYGHPSPHAAEALSEATAGQSQVLAVLEPVPTGLPDTALFLCVWDDDPSPPSFQWENPCSANMPSGTSRAGLFPCPQLASWCPASAKPVIALTFLRGRALSTSPPGKWLYCKSQLRAGARTLCSSHGHGIVMSCLCFGCRGT